MDLESLMPAPTVRNISNSEVTTFLSCQRQYIYAFGYEIEPKVTADPLARGTIGHAFFEHYVLARLEGASHERAYRAGLEVFQNPPKDMPIDKVMFAQFLCQRYMDYHQGWPEWNLLGTEEKLEVQLTEDLKMVIRYDLYYEEIKTGKKKILDFKFSYDFWSPDDHDLNGQMPKYIAVLQANGLQCDGGTLEEIRTRKLGAEKSRDAKNLWRRTQYNPSIARKESVLNQHIMAALRIREFRQLPFEEQRQQALPVLNKHGACKFCNFKDLCNSELEGKQDLSVDIRVGYRTNTYGYNNEEGTLGI